MNIYGIFPSTDCPPHTSLWHHILSTGITCNNIYITSSLVLYSNPSHDLITLVCLYSGAWTPGCSKESCYTSVRIALEHDNDINYTLVTPAQPSACGVYANKPMECALGKPQCNVSRIINDCKFVLGRHWTVSVSCVCWLPIGLP